MSIPEMDVPKRGFLRNSKRESIGSMIDLTLLLTQGNQLNHKEINKSQLQPRSQSVNKRARLIPSLTKPSLPDFNKIKIILNSSTKR